MRPVSNLCQTNKIEFGIDDNPTNDQVSAAIDRVQYRKGGKTFTGKALEVAKGLFKHEDGRKEVMILLTGESFAILLFIFYELWRMNPCSSVETPHLFNL